MLGLLLAAAAWIDIRYRVIPDCVTVPGVLLGLVVVWLVPDVLLPIGCEVPRSFAPPRVESDVLGLVWRPPLGGAAILDGGMAALAGTDRAGSHLFGLVECLHRPRPRDHGTPS